jgi:hypothetical protein
MEFSPTRPDITAASELFQEQTGRVEKDLRDSAAIAVREGRLDKAELCIRRINDVRSIGERIRVCEQDLLATLLPETDGQAAGVKLTAESPHTPESRIRLEPDRRVMHYNGTQAFAVVTPSGWRLLKGSTVLRAKHQSLKGGLRERREHCEASGTLTPAADPEFLTLTKDLEFRSPSAAAQFVAGCSVSGTREWVGGAPRMG